MSKGAIMASDKNRIKSSEIFLSLGCILLIGFQLVQYSASSCVVAFANLPEVCGENVKYLLIVLVLFELSYPALIMLRFLGRLKR